MNRICVANTTVVSPRIFISCLSQIAIGPSKQTTEHEEHISLPSENVASICQIAIQRDLKNHVLILQF